MYGRCDVVYFTKVMSVVFKGLEYASVPCFLYDITKLVVSIIIHYVRAVVNSLGQLAELSRICKEPVSKLTRVQISNGSV